MTIEEENLIKEAEFRHLRKLQIWAWYLKGARDMLLRMREAQLTMEEHIKAASKQYGSKKLKVTAERKVYNRAVFDLLLKDKLNIERFLSGDYTIMFADHEQNKRGKLVKCRACFVRKVVRYEEIE